MILKLKLKRRKRYGMYMIYRRAKLLEFVRH